MRKITTIISVCIVMKAFVPASSGFAQTFMEAQAREAQDSDRDEEARWDRDVKAAKPWLKEESDSPLWSTWRPILRSPRPGSELTAVATNPDDPDHVIVGTDDGGLLSSFDGGHTFQEFRSPIISLQDEGFIPPTGRKFFRSSAAAIRPPDRFQYALNARPTYWLIGGGAGGRPGVTTTGGGGFKLSVNAPNSRYAGTASLLFRSLFFNLKPAYVAGGILPSPGSAGWSSLFFDAVNWSGAQHNPVRRIAFCPGSLYSVVAATDQGLMGSRDQGRTFEPILYLSIPFFNVVCHKKRPGEIYAMTSFGLWNSFDGGESFLKNAVGRAARPGRALGWVQVPGMKKPSLGMSIIFLAYRIDDPKDPPLAHMTFFLSDFDNPRSAPWMGAHHWITGTRNQQIWIATDFGIRISRNAGKDFTWETGPNHLFERRKIRQIEVGETDDGRERIAVLVRDWVYVTDDHGDTWRPFFRMTRRRVQQVAWARPKKKGDPVRWYVVGGGECWATVSGDEQRSYRTPITERPGVDMQSVRWARRQIRNTPPAVTTLAEVERSVGLSAPILDTIVGHAKQRSWLPRLDLEVGITDVGDRRFQTQQITSPFLRSTTSSREKVQLWLQASWALDGTVLVQEELAPMRAALHQYLRQIQIQTWAVYAERSEILRRLASGIEFVEAQHLRARVEMLDAILESWLERPLTDIRNLSPFSSR